MRRTMRKCSRYSGSCGISDCGLQIADCGLKLPRKPASRAGWDAMAQRHARIGFVDRMSGNEWLLKKSSIGAVVPRPLALVPLSKRATKVQSALPSLVPCPSSHYSDVWKWMVVGRKFNRSCRPSSFVPRPFFKANGK